MRQPFALLCRLACATGRVGRGGGGGLNDPKCFGRENVRGGAYMGRGALTVLYGSTVCAHETLHTHVAQHYHCHGNTSYS